MQKVKHIQKQSSFGSLLPSPLLMMIAIMQELMTKCSCRALLLQAFICSTAGSNTGAKESQPHTITSTVDNRSHCSLETYAVIFSVSPY